jgi:hypothetical protein
VQEKAAPFCEQKGAQKNFDLLRELAHHVIANPHSG